MAEYVAAPGMAQLTVKQIGALIGYTVREARYKWTIMALFALTTLFLLGLATIVSVDVVEGTIASARLFGTIPLEIGNTTIAVEDAVGFIQTAIVFLLTTFGLGLALFVTGNIIPLTLQTGWIDLLVSQPISRPALILGRAFGALAVVAATLFYLFGGSWAILTWKTGFGNPWFLVAGMVILFTFLCCYSAMVLVGVLTRNSPVCIIAGLAVAGLGAVLRGLHAYPNWTTAFDAGWKRTLASTISETLYWFLPKSYDLAQNAVNITTGAPFAWMPFLTSLPFTIVCLALACWWFSREDY